MAAYPSGTPEAGVVADLAARAKEPVAVERGDLVVVNGSVVDLRAYADEPARITAARNLHDTASLGRYVAAHDEGRGNVYVDAENLRVVAVLDDHRVFDSEQVPSKTTHTATLQWKHSVEWIAWTEQDGGPLSQVAFAEFLEDHLADVVVPAGADLLELVTTIKASEKGEFKGSTKLRSGSYELAYALDVSLGAGPGGKVELPERITIRIPVFDHQTVGHDIEARVRYRLNGGRLTLQYILDRPDLVHREAIATEVAALQALVGDGVPVYQGSPA